MALPALPYILPLLLGLAAGTHAIDIQQLRGRQAPVRLDDVVMKRSLEELNIAKQASTQAAVSAQAVKVQQQNLISHMTAKETAQNYNKVKTVVPSARAAALETRMYAMKAEQYADHTLRVEEESRHIPEVAAQQSKEAVEGWMRSEAVQAAEASAVTPQKAAQQKTDRLAQKVAAAAEPYHLALIRNQKFTAETYAKAKSAQKSSQELQMKAKNMALTAQQLQASGLGTDAAAMIKEAHSIQLEAENLRQWATKLYSQADAAHSTAGGFAQAEQQAATNAAMTMVIDAPRTLPQ